MAAHITLSASEVAENPENGTPIAVLGVTGGATGETFTYALADSVEDRFAIQHNDVTGNEELIVKSGGSSLFDFENGALNSFSVGISAAGSQQTNVATTDFTIDVTNVNEAPVDLWLHTLSAPTVAEHSAWGTEIGWLSALDPDLHDTVTFSLTDDAGGRFMVDRSGTKLLVADGSKIDYETAHSYQVTVQAMDAGGLTFDKTLTIGVSDAVDTINGSSKNDRLIGTAGDDVINGGRGKDKIYGLAGNDTINGGAGKDILYGGAGKDTFVFDTRVKKGEFDRVVDFNPKDDTLEFSVSSLKSFKIKAFKHGKLNKKFFTLGDHAKDKNDYVFYNKKNGFVYLDSDGSGHKHATPILKLKPGLKLAADDFHFI